MNEPLGQGIAKTFFAQGGFKNRNVISSFKNRFLTLFENSSIENLRPDRDFDLLALASLVFLEADSTDDEIMVLLQFIGKIREEPTTKTPHWFSRLMMELIYIKHSYERGTAWYRAEPLDDIFIDCVNEATEKRISIANQEAFLRNLVENNKHRFSDPLCFDLLHGFKRFLKVLSNDGCTTASYFLLLPGVGNDEPETITTRLARLSEEDGVGQLATLHMGLVYSQDNATTIEAGKYLREALYDFERHDRQVLPALYEGIKKQAQIELEKLLEAECTTSADSEVKLRDIVDEQLYRIKCCDIECVEAARGRGWEILLPIWVSALAVEGGKLVELLWKVSLVSSLRRSQKPAVIPDILAKIGNMPPKSEENFVLMYHGESGHGSGCEQSCCALMSRLLDLWRPKKGVYVMDFLYTENEPYRLAKIKCLFESHEAALHESSADYATLLLANILAVPFDAGHPLGRLWYDGNDGLKSGLARFRKTFDRRNENAHYRLYESKRGIDRNFETVRRSVNESVSFATVLKDTFE